MTTENGTSEAPAPAPPAGEAPPAEAAPVEAEAAPATFAKETKVIIPPPDIKMVVDRTADFVRRVGAAFENEIKQRNKSSKKFGFLQSDNPYHAYYLQRMKYGDKPPVGDDAAEEDASGPVKKEEPVAETEGGEQASTAAGAAPSSSADVKPKVAPKKKKQPQNLKEEMQALIKDVKSVELEGSEPQSNKYSVKTPDLFQASDIEIIKLTAQFVARNGRSFLSGLTEREQRNPQFDFLKPTHPLFSFFQQLVDAYAQIIIPPKKLLAEIRLKVKGKEGFLPDCLVRAKWVHKQQAQEKQDEDKQEEDRKAMQLIDWHQFVVVETISFERGEEEFLPKPKDSIYEIQRMLEAQDLGEGEVKTEGGAGELDGEGNEDDEDMDMDMDEDEDDENLEEDEDVESNARMIVQEDEPEPVVLTEAPADDDLTFGLSSESTKFQKCPVCGEEIAIEDLQEHIRIELLDPKWKQQKELLEEKKKESSLAANQAIMSNLGILSKKRADVFIGRDEVGDETKVKEDEQKSLDVWEKVRREEQEAAAEAARRKAAAPPPRPPMSAPPSARPLMRPTMPGARPMLRQQTSYAPPPPRNAAPRPPMTAPPRPPAPRPPVSAPPVSSPRSPAPKPPVTAPPAAPAAPAPARPQMPMMPGMRPMMGMGGMNMNMMGMGLLGMNNPMMQAQMLQNQTLGMSRPAPGGPAGEPAAKKVKGGMTPEAQWLEQHPEPITVKLVVPQDASKAEYLFHGQTLMITLDPKNTVADFKMKISAQLGNMPGSKMKISFVGGIFLNKDKATFASYNVLSGAAFSLGVRERGGKKK